MIQEISTLQRVYRLLKSPSTADTALSLVLLASLALPVALKVREALNERNAVARPTARETPRRLLSLDDFTER